MKIKFVPTEVRLPTLTFGRTSFGSISAIPGLVRFPALFDILATLVPPYSSTLIPYSSLLCP